MYTHILLKKGKFVIIEKSEGYIAPTTYFLQIPK